MKKYIAFLFSFLFIVLSFMASAQSEPRNHDNMKIVAADNSCYFTFLKGGVFVKVPCSSLPAFIQNSLATTGYFQNGNSFGTNATIGTNDNFPLIFETNGTNKFYMKPDKGTLTSLDPVNGGFYGLFGTKLGYTDGSLNETPLIELLPTGIKFNSLPNGTAADSTLTVSNGLVRKVPSTLSTPNNTYWQTGGNTFTDAVAKIVGSTTLNNVEFYANGLKFTLFRDKEGLFISNSANTAGVFNSGNAWRAGVYNGAGNITTTLIESNTTTGTKLAVIPTGLSTDSTLTTLGGVIRKVKTSELIAATIPSIGVDTSKWQYENRGGIQFVVNKGNVPVVIYDQNVSRDQVPARNVPLTVSRNNNNESALFASPTELIIIDTDANTNIGTNIGCKAKYRFNRTRYPNDEAYFMYDYASWVQNADSYTLRIQGTDKQRLSANTTEILNTITNTGIKEFASHALASADPNLPQNGFYRLTTNSANRTIAVGVILPDNLLYQKR